MTTNRVPYSSFLSIVLPIFASYKALRTPDPALLTPWLTYWVILAIIHLFEYWTYFILSWVPFYSYLRLVLLCYLVLPQTQGARVIYQTYVHPFLDHHESQIDDFIGKAHERAMAAGLSYVKRIVEFLKQNLLGMRPTPQAQPAYQGGSYVQNLMSRFNLPSARQGLAVPAGDFYGLLGTTLVQLGGGGTRETQAEDLAKSGSLIPQGMTSAADKTTFIATQRERLSTLLFALDKEAKEMEREQMVERDVDRRLGEGGGEGLKKSKSEAEFEEIGKEVESVKQGKATGKSSWAAWGLWGTQGKDNEAGKSSSVDPGA